MCKTILLQFKPFGEVGKKLKVGWIDNISCMAHVMAGNFRENSTTYCIKKLYFIDLMI